MTDYKLSRATVINSRDSENNNIYTVRVIPDMSGITEINLLPQYPSFFLNHLETYTNEDVVWCLHTDDFQVGYILGLCENGAGSNLTVFYDKIKELEVKFGLKISAIQDLTFTIIQGTVLDFIDNKTRTNGRLVSNGSSMLFTDDGSIYMDSTNSYIHLGANGKVDIDSTDETHKVDRVYEVKANKIMEVANRKESNISGNLSETVSGNFSKTVIGNNQESYTKESTSTYLTKSKEVVGTGKETLIALGGAKTTILAGDYTITVGLGKITLMTAGGINLIAGVGGVNITSATSIKLTAPLINIATLAASIKTVALKVSPNILGGGPFCAIPFCLFTGVPHTTSTYLGSGI